MEVNPPSFKSERSAAKAAAIGALLILIGLISVAIGPVAFGERSGEWRLLVRYEYAIPVFGYWISVPGCLVTLAGIALFRLGHSAIKQIKLAYPFLFAGAMSSFFSIITALNFLKIEYYEFYSTRQFQIKVFHSPGDILALTVSSILILILLYAMKVSSKANIPTPLVLSPLVLPISGVLYFIGQQDLGVSLLAIGSLLAFAASILYSKELLRMPRAKAILVFLICTFAILLPIEVSSLYVWIRNTLTPTYPFDIDPRWRLPLVDFQLFSGPLPLALALLVIFLLSLVWINAPELPSWVWTPILKRIPRKIKRMWRSFIKPISGYPKLEALTFHSNIQPLTLLVVLLCGVFITYSPYFSNNKWVRGVDTEWYYWSLYEVSDFSKLGKMLISEPRGTLYIVLLYILRAMLFPPPPVDYNTATGYGKATLLVVQSTPILLTIFLMLSTYFFVKKGTENSYLATLAAAFSAFSFHITVGMFTAIFANWLAISIMFLGFTLFLMALEKGSKTCLVAAATAFLTLIFAHVWTWGVLMGILVFYVILTFLHLPKNRWANQELTFPLFTILFNLMPAFGVYIGAWLLPTVFPQIPYTLSTPLLPLLTSIGFENLLNLWPNISYTLPYYVGGAYIGPLIFLLSILGLVYVRDHRTRFNRVILAWVFTTSAVMLFSGRLQWVWRLLYNTPFQVTAALGTYLILIKAKQLIASSDKNAGETTFYIFQALLIAIIFIFLFNYAIRAIVFIY